MKSYLWIGTVALAGLLLGCGSRQEPASQPAAQETATASAAPAGGAAGAAAETAGAMSVEPQAEPDPAAPGASPGKPRAPVEAAVVGQPILQSGVPGKLTLEVRPGVAVEALTVQLTGDAALAIVGQNAFRFGALAAGEPVRVEVAVTPTSGGTGRLSALLTLTVGGTQQARPVSLAFEIGGPVTLRAPAEKPAAPPVMDATGELVHSMPAETTVGKP